ncbi:hypothetical protein BKA67DRAFT_530167 [Truncatella angustata]|uniref:Complex III subunit 9 n=1 Tax=Truncatella angustata TaxID=152316 RepID=A0A9P9A3D7_9PEZI|nr:uncharacterized protein BKA67DRAFT_530167 [Truncatella angustata]KAH6660048.1 hypothetical protein BKA67DRAFT_530167 [Truncatella angustata]
MAGFSPLYNALFRRNAQMLGVVFGAGFAFELIYNQGMNKLWDNLNRGVPPMAGHPQPLRRGRRGIDGCTVKLHFVEKSRPASPRLRLPSIPTAKSYTWDIDPNSWSRAHLLQFRAEPGRVFMLLVM